MVLKITDVAPRFRRTKSLGLNMLAELDCKEPFHQINPEWVTEHMKQASAWLHARKRWRSTDVVWSVDKDHRKLDRAGWANA